MKITYFVPVVGQTYQNRNGEQYLCLGVHRNTVLSDTTAEFERLKDRWTLIAHGIGRYADGTIEWNYSTGGHWPQI